MSWEHSRFKVTCDGCGHEGVVVESSDDWNRSRTTYDGFENVPVSSQAIARMKASHGDSTPRCPKCGGRSVTRGEVIKDESEKE